jgi:hypothetical protein
LLGDGDSRQMVGAAPGVGLEGFAGLVADETSMQIGVAARHPG